MFEVLVQKITLVLVLQIQLCSNKNKIRKYKSQKLLKKERERSNYLTRKSLGTWSISSTLYQVHYHDFLLLC